MWVVGLMLVSTSVFAQHEAAEHAAPAVAAGSDTKMWLAIAAAFGMALASMAGAWSQSKALSSALEGIARNPGASNFTPMIVGMALIEAIVLLTFVVCNSIAGKI